jgi:hypothetical protein
MKKLIYACLLIPCLFLTACTIDKLGDVTGTGGSGSISNLSIPTAPDDRFRVSFDMVKGKKVVPANPADESLLSLTDKIMGTPVFQGFHVELAITADGGLVADIKKVDLPELPSYPVDAVYPYDNDPAELARIEIREDVVHCYNDEGELIGVGAPFVPQSLSNIMTGIQASSEIPADQVQLMVAAFEDAGINPIPTSREGQFMIEVPSADGGLIKTLIDFNLGVQRGQASYKPDGSLNYWTNVNVEWDETSEQIVLTGSTFVSRTQSPLSDVIVDIVEKSTIQNYQFELINE